MSTTPVLDIRDLRYRWPGAHAAAPLQIDHLSLARGERLFLHGPSGSGKSTLLNLIAGTLRPDAGTLMVAGQPWHSLPARRRDALRGDWLGYLFQQFNLLPFLSVLDNVMLPCRFSARRRAQAEASDGSVRASAQRLLRALGLDDPDLIARQAGALSVGQQQRAAAARALIGAPALVLADEPTSALDADSRDAFLALLLQECEHHQTSLLFVSHDLSLASHFPRQAALPTLAAGLATGLNPSHAPAPVTP